MLTKNDLNQIRGVVKEEADPIRKELEEHGKILRSLKKDQSTMLDMLDTEQMKQSRRLKRVEERLGIPASTI